MKKNPGQTGQPRPPMPKVALPKGMGLAAQHSGVDRRRKTFTGGRPRGGAGKY